MDRDPNVEPELDTFSRVLPLPYRIAVIIVLGIWAWALNLYYLYALRIDVASLIRYSHRPGNLPPTYQRVSRLATTAFSFLAFSLILFWLLTHGNVQAILSWQILPQTYLIFLAVLFALPFQQLSKSGRYKFLSTLTRVSVGGISEAQDGKFGDTLLADVLTSYAKVLGDLFVSVCMLLSGGYSTAKPDRNCGGNLFVPLVIAIPSLIRLRQCLIEFGRARASRHEAGATTAIGWGGQHLANALKYSSAFPVIILSALQRGYDSSKIGVTDTNLYRLWLLFVFLNSMYSFYWDVAKDWDLTIFSSADTRDSPDHPWGLRRHRHFQPASLYYGAIAIDFMLRCTWSLKLSPHLDHFNDLEGGIFVMEILEVFRRWLWIFLRVETEWVRTHHGALSEDILLGDYDGFDPDKLDTD